MSDAPYRFLYNPRRAGDDELERTLVGQRQQVLDDVLLHLQSSAKTKTLQHLLLVGPRGAGKSHLISLVHRKIRSSNLNQSWRPIQLPEEIWEAVSVRDVLIVAMEMLQKEPADTWEDLPESLRPDTTLVRLQSEKDLRRGCELGFALFRELTQVTGRRNVLMIENLDMLLDEQFDDDFGLAQLRCELMTENSLMLLATSPGRIRTLEDHNQPLFGLLRHINLEDFSLQELEQLLRERAHIEAEADPAGPATRFLRRLGTDVHRLRALLYLTGGNPRTALMLYQVAVHGQLGQIRLSLDGLLDDMTTYFQSRLRSLPPQERRIVMSLVQSGRAMRPSEIAAEMGISASQVSALIGRLVDRGYLRLAEQSEGKARYYILREVLLRYWREWRNSERAFSLFIDFMAAWFEREELERWLDLQHNGQHLDTDGMLPQILREAIDAQPEVRDRLALHVLLNQQDTNAITEVAAGGDSATSDPLIRRICRDFPVESSSAAGQLEQAAQSGDFQMVSQLASDLSSALQQGTIDADAEIGALVRLIVYQRGANALAASETVYRRRPSQSEVRYLKAYALLRANKYDDAIVEFRQLAADFQEDGDILASASAHCGILISARHLYQQSESQQAGEQALLLYRDAQDRLGQANALLGLGHLAHRINDRETARKHFNQALKLYNAIQDRLGQANALRGLGDLARRVNDQETARKHFNQALKLYDTIQDRLGQANTLVGLGDLARRVNDRETARKHFNQALKLYDRVKGRVGQVNTLRRLSIVQLENKQLEKALKSITRCIKLSYKIDYNSGIGHCYFILGIILSQLNRPGEALQSFEKSINLLKGTQYTELYIRCLIEEIRILSTITGLLLIICIIKVGEMLSIQKHPKFYIQFQAMEQSIKDHIDEATFSNILHQIGNHPEKMRQAGIQAAIVGIELRRKIETHSNEMRQLRLLAQAIIAQSTESSSNIPPLEPSLQCLQSKELADIATAVVNGALIQRLADGQPDMVLLWIEFLETQLGETKHGLWMPIQIAARHLRNAKQDQRILDQQAPEVRAAIMLVLSEVEKRKRNHAH